MRAGRAFTVDEDAAGSPALVAVISDRLWASMFQRDPSAVGRTFRVNGHIITIVGVTEQGFQGLERVVSHDVWLPRRESTDGQYFSSRGIRSDDRARGGGFFDWVGRLTPGSTWPQANTELTSLSAWLRKDTHREREVRDDTLHAQRPAWRRDATTPAAAVRHRHGRHDDRAADHLLERRLPAADSWRGPPRRGGDAQGARREPVAPCAAAPMEGVMLWLLGSVLGQRSGVDGDRGHGRHEHGGDRHLRRADTCRLARHRICDRVAVDRRTALFGGSRAPGHARRGDPCPQAGWTDGDRFSFKTGSVLTVIQLSASLTLLVGALLLAATLRHLGQVDLGFEPAGVTAARVQPSHNRLQRHGVVRLLPGAHRRLASRPGVQSVALAQDVPFFTSQSITAMRRSGEPAESSRDAFVSQVLSPTTSPRSASA